MISRQFARAFVLNFLLMLSTAVLAANLPPTFTPIASQSVTEGQVLSFPVVATDPEGSAVTITASGIKTWMSFSNGVFIATPGTTHSGTYTVGFTAKDASSARSTLRVTITVVNANQPPTVNAISDKSVAEGASLSFTVSASDPDLNAVTLSASPLKSWMTFNGATFTATPGYADSGSYVLTFSASDGSLTGTTQMTLTVTDVNQAPVFSTSASQAVSEGAILSLPISVSDPDGAPLTLTATGLKPWMSLSGSILTLSPGYSDAGSYPITITASDGVKTSKLDMTVTVANANQAPVLADPGNWEIGDGKVLSLPVSATDPDGDPVTITASGLQSWMSFDGKVFRARPAAGVFGSFNISFTASDASSSASKTITVSVVAGGNGYPSAWTSYMGSVGGKADWASWVRHWLAASTGMSLVNNPSYTTDLYNSAAEDLATHDLMLPITGFVRDDVSMSEFLNLIHDGGVATWQEAVRAEVETLSMIDPTAKRTFYQLGNEITTSRISENLRNWAASRGISIPGTAVSFDTEMIPFYAEYFLAPTVEKVMQSSQQYFGDSQAAIIALGSLGSAILPDARGWLDVMLNYQVQGTYAPSLAGQHVYDLVDLITVHYVGPTSNLEEIWDKWQNKGRIKGLWTTEEIGAKAADAGQGAGRALLTTAEQLKWFYQRTLTPEQSRVAYYDWNLSGAVAGTSPDEAIQLIYGFVSNDPLEVFIDGVTLTGSNTDLLTYRLQSALNDGKRMIIATADFTQPLLNASVSTIHFGKEGWTGAVTANVHQFSPAGHGVISASVKETADGYDVTLSPAAILQGDGSALLITLQH